MDNSKRLQLFKRNQKLEFLLKELNNLLEVAEKEALKTISPKPPYPTIFIVGCPRSGTTLMTQWLASLKLLAYPSNLLSRFYKAPYIGSQIQKLIFDQKFEFRRELLNESYDIQFDSNIGKTTGPLSPHEFWYFWRQFFEFPDIPTTNQNFGKTAFFRDFLKELSAIQTAFDQPFFCKGLIMNWYISLFAKHSDNFFFLYIKRDPTSNIVSLLNARKKYFGNIEEWYSFKPKEYSLLKSLTPHQQVAGQIYFTNKTIESELKQVPSERYVEIRYKEFCENPSVFYHQLFSKLENQGYQITLPKYQGKKQFLASDYSILPFDELKKVTEAYSYVQNLHL